MLSLHIDGKMCNTRKKLEYDKVFLTLTLPNDLLKLTRSDEGHKAASYEMIFLDILLLHGFSIKKESEIYVVVYKSSSP